MTRKRRAQAGAVLLVAGVAAVALVAMPAGAHTPATFEFTNGKAENTRIVSRQDGTGETAHQLFFIPSVGTITCSSPGYQGTSSTLLNTVLQIEVMGYNGCKIGLEGVTFKQEECELTFTATGEMVISLIEGGAQCGMTFTLNGSGCVITIPEQTVSGVAYTNIKGAAELPEVTATITVTGTRGSRGAKCASPGNFVAGEIKKGNVVFGGVEDNKEAKPVGLEWLATVP